MSRVRYDAIDRLLAEHARSDKRDYKAYRARRSTWAEYKARRAAAQAATEARLEELKR